MLLMAGDRQLSVRRPSSLKSLWTRSLRTSRSRKTSAKALSRFLVLGAGLAGSIGGEALWHIHGCRSQQVQEDRLGFVFPKSYLNKPPSTIGPAFSPEVVKNDLAIVLVFAAIGYVVTYSQQVFLCVPREVQEKILSPPTPNAGALLAAGLYGCNISYNVINKRLLSAHPHPFLVTGINLGMCTLCCLAAWASGLQKLPQRLTASQVKRMLPLMVLHWMGMLFSNVSVSEVHISFTHTVKAAEPLFTALFTICLIGERPSLKAWGSLMLVIAGIAVATTAQTSFTWLGFWAAMASNVTVSLRTVLSKRLIMDKGADPMNFMAILQCGAFIASLPVALVFNIHAVKDIASRPSSVYFVLVIGPLVWIFNCASIVILSQTSTVVHSMIRAMRRPVLVLASIVAFGTGVSVLNGAGILLAFLGAWFFKFEAVQKQRSD